MNCEGADWEIRNYKEAREIKYSREKIMKHNKASGWGEPVSEDKK